MHAIDLLTCRRDVGLTQAQMAYEMRVPFQKYRAMEAGLEPLNRQAAFGANEVVEELGQGDDWAVNENGADNTNGFRVRGIQIADGTLVFTSDVSNCKRALTESAVVELMSQARRRIALARGDRLPPASTIWSCGNERH